MNMTATAGTNLQTPTQATTAQKGHGIRLVSPTAPDDGHRALFSGLAKRQRKPRRHRYRDTFNLKPWQVEALHRADAVARQLGFPLNTFVTINYHGTFPGAAQMPMTFKRAMKRAVQWFRDQGLPAAYIYTHENPHDERPNSHMLMHLPKRLRGIFSERASSWFQALDGGVKVDLRSDGRKRDERLQYMCKGADFLTCRRFGGHRAKGGQGPVIFKRAGVSEFLSGGFSDAQKKAAEFRDQYARARLA